MGRKNLLRIYLQTTKSGSKVKTWPTKTNIRVPLETWSKKGTQVQNYASYQMEEWNNISFIFLKDPLEVSQNVKVNCS